MARPTWATDALGTALFLLGKPDLTLAKLNQLANRDNRIAQATTVATSAVTHNGTTINVASATGFPATNLSYFARLVYTPAALTEWAADTVTAVGDVVIPKAAAIAETPALANVIYECTARGGDFKTHASTEPDWKTKMAVGETIVDDAVTWTAYERGVDEVVKVTGRTTTALTVTRNARGLGYAGGGTLVGAKGGANHPFPVGTVLNVLGTHITQTQASPHVGYTAGEAAALGTLLNRYFGISKVYGERVFKMAKAKDQEITFTVVD